MKPFLSLDCAWGFDFPRSANGIYCEEDGEQGAAYGQRHPTRAIEITRRLTCPLLPNVNGDGFERCEALESCPVKGLKCAQRCLTT
jgi:hypothetical protein